MVGGYDYYYLTQHGDNPDEPPHLSRRADPAEHSSTRTSGSCADAGGPAEEHPAESERREIVSGVILPRMLIRHGYLRAMVGVGPNGGTPALRRLAKLLADPLVAELDPAGVKGVTGKQLAVIARRTGLGWRTL